MFILAIRTKARTAAVRRGEKIQRLRVLATSTEEEGERKSANILVGMSKNEKMLSMAAFLISLVFL